MKNNKEKSSYILTRETLGMTILLFSALVFIMLLTGSALFAGIGKAVCTFMYGSFGYGSYLLVLLAAYLGEWLVFEKKIKFPWKPALAVSATIFVLFLLFHSVSTHGYELNGYGEYLSQCYNNAELGFAGYTFGGILSALLVYPIAKGTTFIGAYIIFSILAVLCIYLSFLTIRDALGKKPVKVEEEAEKPNLVSAPKIQNYYPVQNEIHSAPAEVPRTYAYPEPVQKAPPAPFPPASAPIQENREREKDKFSDENLGRRILFANDEFAAESYRRNMIFNESSYFNNPVHNDDDYLKSFGDGFKKNVPAQNETYSSSYQDEIQNQIVSGSPSSYVYGDKPVDKLEDYSEQIHADSYKTDSYNADLSEGLTDDAEINEDFAAPPATSFFEKEEKQNGDAFSNSYREEIESRNECAEPPRSQPILENSEPRFERDYSDIVKRDEPAVEEKKTEERNSLYNLFSASNMPMNENSIQPDVGRLNTARRERNNSQLFDDDGDDELFSSDIGSLASPDREVGNIQSENIRDTFSGRGSENRRVEPFPEKLEGRRDMPLGRTDRKTESEQQQSPPAEEKKEPEKPKHVWKKYVRPTLDLLDDYPENANINTAEIEEAKCSIVETLATFRIESEISDVVIGPAITRYDVIIKDKANIKNSLKYREAISMALMKDNVNFYLNYAKGALSIEVPNSKQATVGLKTMLVSPEFMNSKPNSLTFALGKKVDGRLECPDITKMPHLLVAGTTGSGKSICLSSLIISLLYKYGPEELRFILVDPKQVEFISYDKLPHLMINEIIFDVDKAIKALNWAISEMERRYALFKEMTEKGIATKNLTEYNNHLPEGEEKLPKIVIILDEFGDLMMQAKKDIEGRIIRLVQKSRACGIHLILATQRPSVDCITGLIKSNLPTRIGFKVGSFDDSRTIFDLGGAEKLLGKGDMYYRSADNPELSRIQGCFIDTHEVQRVTDFVKQNNETYFDQSVSDFINKVEAEVTSDSLSGGDAPVNTDTKIDDSYIKALHYCVMSNQASVSMLQRRFPIGYMKACKIVDWMEDMNYITPSEGSKPRKVLLSKEEFTNIYGDVDD